MTALNPDQYGNGLGNHSPVCGNTITATFEGKSAVVTVIDMGGVGPGGLDLSIAAFEHFQVSTLHMHLRYLLIYSHCAKDSSTPLGHGTDTTPHQETKVPPDSTLSPRLRMLLKHIPSPKLVTLLDHLLASLHLSYHLPSGPWSRESLRRLLLLSLRQSFHLSLAHRSQLSLLQPSSSRFFGL
jgi:hypothetical protein